MAAGAARFGGSGTAPGWPYHDTPEFAAFLEEWPYPSFPGGAPAWWRPPPGMLARMRERTDPWIDGKARDIADGRDLVPADIDLTKPWPWRAELGEA